MNAKCFYFVLLCFLVLFSACKVSTRPKSRFTPHKSKKSWVSANDRAGQQLDEAQVLVLQKKNSFLLTIAFELHRQGDVPHGLQLEPEKITFSVSASTFQQWQKGDVLQKHSLLFTSFDAEGAKETYQARIGEKVAQEEYRVSTEDESLHTVSSDEFYALVAKIQESEKLCVFAQDMHQQLWQLLSPMLRETNFEVRGQVASYELLVSAEHKKLARFWKQHVASAKTQLSFRLDVEKEEYEQLAEQGKEVGEEDFEQRTEQKKEVFVLPTTDPALLVTVSSQEKIASGALTLLEANDGSTFFLTPNTNSGSTLLELHNICLRVKQ